MRVQNMLSLLPRAVAGPLGSLGRSPFSSLAPWWRTVLLPAPVSRALPPWCGTAAPRPLLALPLPPGLLPPSVAGLKSKVSLKRRCKDCFMVRRRGRLYVLCKTNPRHKQRQL